MAQEPEDGNIISSSRVQMLPSWQKSVANRDTLELLISKHILDFDKKENLYSFF